MPPPLKHITQLLFLIISCGLGVTLVNVNSSISHVDRKVLKHDDRIEQRQQQQQQQQPTPITEIDAKDHSDHGVNSEDSLTSEGDTDSDTDRIMFFCMQTKKASAWCRMLESASHFGISIDHPSWGSSYTHAKRIGWVLKAISKLPDSTIVSFSDGTDVMFNGGASEIMNRFRQLEEKNSKSLFFNAEKSCYAQQAFPDAPCSKGCKWALRKARCIASYRNNVWINGTSEIPKWRYLNAGCFIGRVGAVRQFFQKVYEVTFKSDGTLRSGIWCDQSMITKVLLSKSMSHIVSLDVDNRIYLPTYHLHSSIDLCPQDSLHVCGTPGDEQPLIFHLNGKSASSLHTHPWSGIKGNPNSIHKILGVNKRMSEICS